MSPHKKNKTRATAIFKSRAKIERSTCQKGSSSSTTNNNNNNNTNIRFVSYYTLPEARKTLLPLIHSPVHSIYSLKANRGLREYQHYFFHLRFGLGTYLYDRQNLHSTHGWNVLDCGAGKASFLDSILSTNDDEGREKYHIQQATGISLHVFPDITKLVQKHQGKLNWFFNSGKEILPILSRNYSGHYHLLVDLWGIYFYSPERALILFHYYQLLTPGGRAYVFIGDTNTVLFEKGKNTHDSLEEHLIKKWPDIFEYGNDFHQWISIQKSLHSQHSEDLGFLLKMKISSIKNHDLSETISYPVKVVYTFSI